MQPSGNQLTSAIVHGSPDSIFVIRQNSIAFENAKGRELREEYSFDLLKVLDVCRGEGCPLHPVETVCHQCLVKSEWNPMAFPLILENKQGEHVNFSASYWALAEEAEAGSHVLVIRDITQEDRLQQLIQKKQLIDYVNAAHEKERKLLAQELHDGLAQSIYSLMLTARKTKWLTNQEEKMQQLQLIDDGLNDLLKEVRTMALDLRPSVLDDLGLVPSIQTLIKRLEETTGMEIRFHIELQQQRFDPAIETMIYRIVQESLSNGIKYAEVEVMEIQLIQDQAAHLLLEVSDRGVGFNTEEPIVRGTGLGLLNMQERAEALNGSMEIISAIGVGTTLRVKVPI